MNDRGIRKEEKHVNKQKKKKYISNCLRIYFNKKFVIINVCKKMIIFLKKIASLKEGHILFTFIVKKILYLENLSLAQLKINSFKYLLYIFNI